MSAADEIISSTISAGGDPAAALARLAESANDSYWTKKDLPQAVHLSQAGIAYGQRAADECRASDPALAEKLLGAVKGVAYNLASFTWPGWDEQGIAISDADLAIGLSAAALNHRLAIELGRPAAKVADSYWLMGAHALASGWHDEAIAHFKAYGEMAPELAHQILARGYGAVALAAAGRHSSDVEQEFRRAVSDLKGIASEDATFFADQLLTVHRVFVKR